MSDSTRPTSSLDRHSPGEFELIAALKRVIDGSKPAPGVVLGIGDDAAAVESEAGVEVLTTDTMVDGVHFVRGQSHWSDVGWKSAVSNLSDIAAMGATPLHALVTIGVSPGVSLQEMEQLCAGLTEAFGEFSGGIIGGDVVSSPVFFVTVALTGRARELDGVPVLMRRDAAQPGDLIGVTGRLGGPAGGLRVLIEGLGGPDADTLKKFHFRPVPRLAEAERMIRAGVRCAMDISDGLVGDLEKICAASEVGAVINAPDVPMPVELKTLFGDEAVNMALSGGEDYELVFTAPFDLMDMLLARHRGVFTHIGRIVAAPDEGEKVIALDAAGSAIDLPRRGWDHLVSR